MRPELACLKKNNSLQAFGGGSSLQYRKRFYKENGLIIWGNKNGLELKREN